MRWRLTVLLVILGLILFPAVAMAQENTAEDDFLLSINRPIQLGAGETASSVVVISGDATVAGTIRDTLVVINGDAVVSGEIQGDINVINGSLQLQPGALVKNVTLLDSTMTRADGATVTGSINERGAIDFDWGFGFLSALWWLGVTIAVLVAGLIFAAFGGRQLTGAGQLIATRPLNTITTALVVVIAVPMLAVAAMITIIGIPLGIALMLFFVPAIWFLGYLVAGTSLGAAVLRAVRPKPAPEHPYLAAVVGLLILQVVGLVPILGLLVAMVAGMVGAGALVYLGWRGWRGPQKRTSVPAPSPTSTPTAHPIS